MTQYHIRLMIRRDMDDVMEIERQAFSEPWSEDDMTSHLRQRNCIAMVAERDTRVVGFMVFLLHKDCIALANLAVADDCRRQGAGTAMIDTLKNKLTNDRRRRVMSVVSERDVTSQLFFRSQGFLAKAIHKDVFAAGCDGYEMRCDIAAMAVAKK